MHELRLRSGERHHAIVDAVVPQQFDAFGPHVFGLAHRHPHVGVHELHPGDSFVDIFGDGDARAGLLGALARQGLDVRRGPQGSGATMRTSEPRMAPVTSSELPMLKRASPT